MFFFCESSSIGYSDPKTDDIYSSVFLTVTTVKIEVCLYFSQSYLLTCPDL